ncbi:MAG: hypothetical protein R2861_16720 [Desulfobacterales bacterium]
MSIDPESTTTNFIDQGNRVMSSDFMMMISLAMVFLHSGWADTGKWSIAAGFGVPIAPMSLNSEW